MAQIHKDHHPDLYDDYDDAERLVVNELRDKLPDDFWVIPSVEIDGAFMDSVLSVWQEIGPILSEYRN